MNAAAATQQSIQAVNDMMKQASGATLQHANKMVKVAVQMQVDPAAKGTVSSDGVDVQA